MKLINNSEYLLLIDEEIEIKEGDYFTCDYQVAKCTGKYSLKVTSFIKCEKGDCSKELCTKIIASYPEIEGLPLLPVPFKGEITLLLFALEQVLAHEKRCADKFEPKIGNDILSIVHNSINAYKAAQQKEFSREDIEKAIELSHSACRRDVPFGNDLKEQIIQSLSTQQLPKEFIPEYVKRAACETCNNQGLRHCNFPEECGEWEEVECMKTITNSEGKQELVGTYKY